MYIIASALHSSELFVIGPGLEPKLIESKSIVLPLHHPTMWAGIRIRTEISGLEDQSTNRCAIPAYALMDGFEPTTNWLTVNCATTALHQLLVGVGRLELPNPKERIYSPPQLPLCDTPKNKKPPNFWLEGLYNLNVIYTYPNMTSSNNARLPNQIRFGWL